MADTNLPNRAGQMQRKLDKLRTELEAAKSALAICRSLRQCDQHEIEYLRNQVRALNGALGR